LSVLVKARNDLQEWLTTILMYPNARDSPVFRNFLTFGANTIPPQYEGVVWTQFNTVPAPVPSLVGPAASSASRSAAYASHEGGGSSSVVDDMEMDDMFLAGDEGPGPQEDHDADDDMIPAASERYKPIDEAVTDEDEMDIMQHAGEVEMVDDIGSLAQSLGASHLGRSLQRQAEINMGKGGMQLQPAPLQQQQGLTVRAPPVQPKQSVGGIGSAMAKAEDQFNYKPPVSAPRLDSFKMIKVIGKGSFGKYFQEFPFLFVVWHSTGTHARQPIHAFFRQSISR
jgi:hypothetical protein